MAGMKTLIFFLLLGSPVAITAAKFEDLLQLEDSITWFSRSLKDIFGIKSLDIERLLEVLNGESEGGDDKDGEPDDNKKPLKTREYKFTSTKAGKEAGVHAKFRTQSETCLGTMVYDTPPVFECEGQPTEVLEVPTRSGCLMTGEEPLSFCVCPLDYDSGYEEQTCGPKRPISCKLERLSPKDNCPPENTTASFGYPVCLSVDRQQLLFFKYKVNCSFTDTLPIRDSPIRYYSVALDAYKTISEYQDEMPYFALNTETEFGISDNNSAVHPTHLKLKVWDFNRLSDDSAAQLKEMTPSVLTGKANISFTLPVGDVGDNFFPGGRAFIEARYHPAKAVGDPNQASWMIIDLEGWELGEGESAGSGIWLAIILCLVIVGALLIGLPLGLKIQRLRRKAAEDQILDDDDYSKKND